MWILTTRLSLIAIAVTMMSAAADGQTILTVAGTAELAFPSAGDQAPEFNLTADFDTEQVGSVSAVPVTVKGPSGRQLNRDVCKIEGPTTGQFPNRVSYVATFASSALVRPGEYLCTLRFDATKKGGTEVLAAVQKELKVTRLEPDLTADSTQERTIAIVRPFPGLCKWAARTCGSGEARLRVTESTRDSPVDSLAVVPGPVFETGTTRQTAGSAMPTATPLALPPGGSGEVVVTLNSFAFAGQFETGLSLESPNFAASKSQTLKIEVTDFWLYPLIVILLGVWGGAWVNKFVNRTRPAMELQLAIVPFRDRLLGLKSSLEEPSDRIRYQDIARMLDDVDGLISSNKPEAAQAQLKVAETQLNDLKEKITKAVSAQHGRLTELQRDLDDTVLHDMFSQLDRDAEGDKLEKAGSDLDSGRPVAAGKHISEVENTLRQTYADVRQKLVDTLDAYHPPPPEAKLKAANEISAKVHAALERPDDTDTLTDFSKALTLLLQLDAAVDKLEPQAAVLRGRGPPRTSTVSTEPRIRILTATSDRRAGDSIRFRLEPSPAGIAGDDIRWTFDDAEEASGVEVGHTFFVTGTHTVSVAFGSSQPSLEVLIMPSRPVQQRDALIEVLNRKEWIVSMIAALLAALSGLSQLYVDQAFGSLNDYIGAVLWGFGVERGLRGFSAVFTKLNG